MVWAATDKQQLKAKMPAAGATGTSAVLTRRYPKFSAAEKKPRKNRKRKMIKNIILLLLVFNVANANNTDKVKLFLNNLYSHYINEDPSFSFSNEKADTIFAPKLLELIRLDQKLANGENGYIDYDPLCSCQDNGNFKLKDIKIKVSKDTVFANVAFSISITDITLLIKLTYQNKKWLIEDIVSKDGSLFNFLKTSLDENNPNSIYKNNKE